MPLGIRPTVDFAFKLLLGSPEHTAITVHFLNAVLQCTPRIERVEILNPILATDELDDKLSILDVLATDEAGRRFNIEMQTSLPAGLSQRLVYYACSLYVDQLGAGENYLALRPAIGICVLERPLLADANELHTEFRLRSTAGRNFSDDLQIHLIELSKSLAGEDNIEQASSLERWSYFLSHADRYSADDLRSMLPEPAFKEAIGVLEMIARDPDQRITYNARLKFQRDEDSRLTLARIEARKEGEQIGLEKGEQIGLEKGELIGRLKSLEELLGLTPTETSTLTNFEHADLVSRIADLQRRLRERLA